MKYFHIKWYQLKTTKSKIFDAGIEERKIFYNRSIAEELVKEWIEVLKEPDILDEDGNLISVEF